MCPVLCQFLPPGNGEVLCARAQGVLDKHPMFAVLPSVQALLYPPSYGVVCSDMTVSLQYHCLEDDEPLQNLLYIPHSLQLSPDRPDETSPDLLNRRVIAPQWHDRKVTPPCLSRRVVTDATSKWVPGLA